MQLWVVEERIAVDIVLIYDIILQWKTLISKLDILFICVYIWFLRNFASEKNEVTNRDKASQSEDKARTKSGQHS